MRFLLLMSLMSLLPSVTLVNISLFLHLSVSHSVHGGGGSGSSGGLHPRTDTLPLPGQTTPIPRRPLQLV